MTNVSTPCHLIQQSTQKIIGKKIMRMLRTFYNYPHIISKSMGNTQCLCDSHPRLLLGQLVQIMQTSLNLILPK